MLIVNVDSKTPLEKALKIFKSKVIKTKLMTELKNRKDFTKKSVKKRTEIKKAIYSENFRRKENN
jgi:small subunit ribosomal protein S21